MKNNWDLTKELFTNSLEKMVEAKYITINKIVSIDGLGAFLANELSTFEQKKKIQAQKIKEMYNSMENYYPEKFEKFIKLISSNTKEGGER